MIMNELLKIEVNEKQEQVINGRQLHEFLEVKTAYKDWFPRMCEYGFSEGIDFCSKMSESTGGRPSVDHTLTLDMAKELCMLARSEKGKQARQYFLQIERDWNSPEKVMARALLLANKKLEQQTIQIESQKPKVLFADSVAASHTTILVGELAKLLKQNGIDMGQNRLFGWMRNNGFLISRNGTDYNMPTQKAMNMGLFVIKETSVVHSDGHTSVNKTPKITGKGQQYFINKFLGENPSAVEAAK